jgi:protein TonB
METEKGATLSAEEQKKRDEIQHLIVAEKEAKKKREAEAEAERQKALQQARQEAAASQAATATAVAAVKVTESRPTVPPPPTQAAAQPTPAATTAVAPPTAAAGPVGAVTITENMFLHPSEVDTLPVMVKEEKVKWSRAASRSNKKGMVIVQATVGADGKVESVTVLRADEDGFDIPQSVIEAVKKYRFKPATKNGIKVKSYATVTSRFNFRSTR